MAASGPDLRAVGGACNSAQLRNITLCNCLQEVHRSVSGMLGRLPHEAAEALAAPLAELQAAAVEAVAPTFRALVEGAEELLLQMHSAPAYAAGHGSGAGAGGAAPAEVVTDTSAFMRELARQLAHCRLEFLTKFNPSPASPVPSGALGGMGLPGKRLTGSCNAGSTSRGSARLAAQPGLVQRCPQVHPNPTPPTHPSAVARALVERMAARLVLFAVRHASLLRPLPEAAKLHLAKVSGVGVGGG